MLDFNFLNNKSKITLTNGIIEGALLMQNVGELKKLLVDSSKMLTASNTHYYFCMGLLAFMIVTQLGIFGLFSMIKTTTNCGHMKFRACEILGMCNFRLVKF
jgi:hypothetical protein